MNTGKRNISKPAKFAKIGKQRANQLAKARRKVKAYLPARTKDNFMLVLLMVMGLSGFAYILSIPAGNKTHKRSLFSKIFDTKETQSITSNFIKSNLITIDGEMKANSPLTFNFDGLSEDHEYEINLGNNEIIPIESNKLTHSYDKVGTYKIEMKKISRGHTFMVHCEYLQIQ